MRLAVTPGVPVSARWVVLSGLAISVLLTGACRGSSSGGGTPTPSGSPTAPAVIPGPSRQSFVSPSALASPSPAAGAGAASAAGGQTYTVQSGDTLLSIATKFYNDSSQWQKIYNANKSVIGDNPDKLQLGEKLTIPPK